MGTSRTRFTLAAAAAALPGALGFACGARSDLSRPGPAEGTVDASFEVGVDGAADVAREVGEPAHDAATDEASHIFESGLPDVPVVLHAVTGTVVDGHLVPMGGLHVRSGPSVTTTAADGTFTLQAPGPPYDLVVTTAGSQGHAHGWCSGRSRARTRRCSSWRTSSRTRRRALSSTAPSRGYLPDRSLQERCWPTSPVPQVDANWTPVYAGDSTYALPLGWRGPTAVSATGYALTWQTDSSAIPTAFQMLVSDPITLTAGVGTTWNTPTIGLPVTTNAFSAGLSGQCTGAPVWWYQVFYRVAKGGTAALLVQNFTGKAAVPDAVPGNTVVACVSAYCGTVACVADLAPTASTVSIDTPQIGPDAASSLDPGSAVSWRFFGATSAVTVLELENRSTSGPRYFVVTTAPSTEVPDWRRTVSRSRARTTTRRTLTRSGGRG